MGSIARQNRRGPKGSPCWTPSSERRRWSPKARRDDDDVRGVHILEQAWQMFICSCENLVTADAIESISKINLQHHCVIAVTLDERTCCMDSYLCTQSNTKTQKAPEGVANGNWTNTSIFLSDGIRMYVRWRAPPILRAFLRVHAKSRVYRWLRLQGVNSCKFHPSPIHACFMA